MLSCNILFDLFFHMLFLKILCRYMLSFVIIIIIILHMHNPDDSQSPQLLSQKRKQKRFN